MRNLSWKFWLAYFFSLAVLLGGVGRIFYRYVQDQQIQSLEKTLSAQAVLLGGSLHTPLSDRDAASLAQNAADWGQAVGNRILIFNQQGDLIAASQTPPTSSQTYPEVLHAIQDGVPLSGYDLDPVGGIVFAVTPIQDGENIFGAVRVESDLSTVNAQLQSLRGKIVLAVGIVFLIVSASTLTISTLISTPFKRLSTELTQEIEEISGYTSAAASSNPVDELAAAVQRTSLLLSDLVDALGLETEKLAAILDQITNGVMIVNEEGRAILVNAAAANLFDVEAVYAQGKSLIEIIKNHLIVDLWETCQTTNSPQIGVVEIPLTHKSLQITVSPLQGRLSGFAIFTFSDLTDIKKLETVRRDFISNISHELRTPLASLKALAETLLAGALMDENVARRFLGQMVTEVDSLALMVQELLELSRIESGKVPLHLSPIEPVNLVESAVERLLLQARNKGQTISTHPEKDLPNFYGDQPRLEQVLVNLLHNAIKFTPDGGQIDLGIKLQNTGLVFTVQDNGPGIPHDELPRIFERFYKADRSRSKGGTGLGLAIAKHLVEAHGGKIWAESERRQGSTFSFYIPLTDQY